MAFGSSTIQGFGAAVQDLYAASALRSKGQGLRAEAEEYTLAARLADQNAQYTKESTDIKAFQANRDIMKTVGQQQADVAANGFANSGSALDLMRDSVTQGAITVGALRNQGAVQEAGYEEQAQSYRIMTDAANQAATAADKAAHGANIAAMFAAAGAVVSMMPSMPAGGGGAPTGSVADLP